MCFHFAQALVWSSDKRWQFVCFTYWDATCVHYVQTGRTGSSPHLASTILAFWGGQPGLFESYYAIWEPRDFCPWKMWEQALFCLKWRDNEPGCKFCFTEHSQKVQKWAVSIQLEQKPPSQVRRGAVGMVWVLRYLGDWRRCDGDVFSSRLTLWVFDSPLCFALSFFFWWNEKVKAPDPQ